MKMRKCFGNPIAACLAILLVLQLGNLTEGKAQQVPSTAQGAQESAPAPSNQQPAANSNTSGASSAPSYPDAPTPAANPSSESSSSDQQNGETKPLGTAAAPYTKPTGVMGSRPAGAVIAPARQRRVHTILISIGILAGAGIAIGTVAALSKGSPSRP